MLSRQRHPQSRRRLAAERPRRRARHRGETWGSAPRPVGSNLVTRQEGNFLGSVRGCVEGAVVTAGADVIEKRQAGKCWNSGVADETAWEGRAVLRRHDQECLVEKVSRSSRHELDIPHARLTAERGRAPRRDCGHQCRKRQQPSDQAADIAKGSAAAAARRTFAQASKSGLGRDGGRQSLSHRLCAGAAA